MDVIQSRYTWVSDDQLKKLRISRILQLYRQANQARKEEHKQRLLGHALTAFYIYRGTPLEPPAKHMEWPEWVEAMGLGKEENSPENARKLRELEIARAYRNVEPITSGKVLFKAPVAEGNPQ